MSENEKRIEEQFSKMKKEYKLDYIESQIRDIKEVASGLFEEKNKIKDKYKSKFKEKVKELDNELEEVESIKNIATEKEKAIYEKRKRNINKNKNKIKESIIKEQQSEEKPIANRLYNLKSKKIEILLNDINQKLDILDKKKKEIKEAMDSISEILDKDKGKDGSSRNAAEIIKAGTKLEESQEIDTNMNEIEARLMMSRAKLNNIKKDIDKMLKPEYNDIQDVKENVTNSNKNHKTKSSKDITKSKEEKKTDTVTVETETEEDKSTVNHETESNKDLTPERLTEIKKTLVDKIESLQYIKKKLKEDEKDKRDNLAKNKNPEERAENIFEYKDFDQSLAFINKEIEYYDKLSENIKDNKLDFYHEENESKSMQRMRKNRENEIKADLMDIDNIIEERDNQLIETIKKKRESLMNSLDKSIYEDIKFNWHDEDPKDNKLPIVKKESFWKKIAQKITTIPNKCKNLITKRNKMYVSKEEMEVLKEFRKDREAFLNGINITNDDKSITNDDKSITNDDKSITNDDKSITNDVHKTTKEEDKGR